MRMDRLRTSALTAASLLLASASAGWAQPQALTLERAIELARQNNPQYRQTLNDEGVADWAVRSSYASLLPTLSAANSFSYRLGGTPRIGDLSADELGLGATPATYSSYYSISVRTSLSASSYFRLAAARANRRATEAQIDAADYDLVTQVTQQYLNVLRARDDVTISRTALESADEIYKLADARNAAGAATRLDVTQAQVDRGRAEVALLQAENAYDTERLRLAQIIGLEFRTQFEPTSTFTVFEPVWTVDQLVTAALASHPRLVSARTQERAAAADAKEAWSTYLPSVALSASWSGSAIRVGSDRFLIEQARSSVENRIEDCEFWNTLSAGLSEPLPGRPEDCTRFQLTPEQETRIVESNRAFPFHYEPNPASFGLSISLPIWDGLSRQYSVEAARAAAEDARYRRRAEELALHTEIATRLSALQASYRTVQIEERNLTAAEEQLTIARERYRLGAGCGAGNTGGLCTTFLELTQARERMARADRAHLEAVYAFHETLVALEAAVGQPLD